MANRFTLTRELTNAKAPGDGQSQQFRLIDTTTGKQWVQARTMPPTNNYAGAQSSSDADIAALIQTMLTALAPTA